MYNIFLLHERANREIKIVKQLKTLSRGPPRVANTPTKKISQKIDTRFYWTTIFFSPIFLVDTKDISEEKFFAG